MPGVMADARADRHVPFDEGAEQQVLGSLLIDRDAIFKIADLLRADDFYLARHQRVYAAAQALLERRERIDPITIQVELARREELDRAGGQAYLRSLADGVPTAVEIERHAHVVRDRAILRRLLGAATAIAADAYDEPTDIPLALDRAEQRLFALRDESANAQLRHITATLPRRCTACRSSSTTRLGSRSWSCARRRAARAPTRRSTSSSSITCSSSAPAARTRTACKRSRPSLAISKRSRASWTW